jgi:hypothetical protein
MFSLFSKARPSVPATFSLIRRANQVAQSNPALAAKLRMRAYAPELLAIESDAASKPRGTKSVTSIYALNSRANRIAQSKPELAIQLRLQAAYS